MYNVKWDPEINGILLSDDGEIVPPRPVFYEELDLLGFDKSWNYPKCENPLLWANGRRYFYKGELVAIAKGGNAIDLPKIEFEKGYENLKLEEIDIDEVIRRNKDELFVLENEAIDFIDSVTTKYPDYPFSVSFSGGKDSQSVLDLVTRVIHSDDVTIIFSDTTLEHDYTYQTVDESIKFYKEKCPDLKFNVAKPVKSANELFKDMGLPSRFHRWCTPALKTAPYNKLINELVDSDSKIIVFEGVRGEESVQRSKYKRIADGAKHPAVINARPILYWNFSEVVLYNFYRNLPMNPLYRKGLSRVGCELCPYSSEWSESIIAHITDKFQDEYIPLIKDYAIHRGLSDEKDLNNFVSEGHWKKRAGGKGLNSVSTITFSQTLKSFKAVLIKPSENFLEWIKVLGEVSVKEENNTIYGELNLDGNYISFSIIQNGDKQIIEFFDIQNDVKLQNKLKRILQKSTFCVHCGVCDAECKNGAINTNPIVQINSNLCDNCENCINFTRHGCYRAKSIDAGSGDNNMSKRTTGIDKYSTFGLRQEWLEEFLYYGNDWSDNQSLGPKQIPAVTNWLSEAELMVHKTKEMTELGFDLKEIYDTDPLFVWGVIWINLYYNSKVVGWYCNNVDWGVRLSKDDLLATIMESFPDLSKGTLNNAISALINMFDNSPLGDDLKLGIIEKKGRAVKSIDKDGVNNELDMLLVAYALYKFRDFKSRSDFTVTELYDENCEGGPYKLFGLSESEFERILRGLQQSNKDIIKVDLAADLDNIFLDDGVTCENIIKFKKEGV
ncbi:MAG: phosphoadenosine phosphosulfate reductase family protein [Methanobrevibacter sp.]|uniref:phosphoadenosine phosphosulfate reductase domain-containing protein n=1 Tax=Methanobrevibacter sp. TaxID=66852 RepID=UPI002E760A75|nr:phosphoadenosine phosphosulfate reductase family protein [Methanobrevibacter sp.]MEE0935321.1 phosphoadenosine phosphosulfate reductase family protein [Methanobrevibacter sp.]